MLYFRFIVINIVLLFSLSLYSQAPGYLGKRLFIEGQGGVASTYIEDVSLYGGSEIEFKTTFMSEFALNWVSKRHSYIALEFNSRQYLEDRDPLQSFPSLRYKTGIRSIGIGLYRTMKRSGGSLAPLGRFWGCKIFYAKINTSPVEYADTGFEFGGGVRAAYDLEYETPSVRYVGLALSLGSRTIIQDRYTLKYALDIGRGYETGVNGEANYAYPKSDLRRYAAFFLNFSIGAGILLF